MIYIRSQAHFWNNFYVNLQNNIQCKEQQTWTNRFYRYPGSALSALWATGLVRLVLLSGFMRCSLAVKVEIRVLSVLTLATDSTALREWADHCSIFIMSPTFGVLDPLWTVVTYRASKECDGGIARRILGNTFANGSVSLRLPPCD